MKKSTRTRKLFIGLTLAASVFAMTLPIVAESVSEYGEGYIPPQDMPSESTEKSSDRLLTASDYPSSYDSRQQTWWKGIEVKDQDRTGLCWAFATCTASEISYAKESGKTAVSLSPGHLGYFMYNRATTIADPLGNTLGDYAGGASKWYSVGGNAQNAMFALAGRTGYATSTTAPYANWVGFPSSFSGYNDSIAYTDYLVLENADHYYSSYSDFSQDTIKGLLTKYGAVFCSLTGIQSEYCKDNENGYYSLNYDGGGYATHAVTMIGWDDNYSKDNFPDAHKPDNNGAWLIQNSWGDSYQYVWVSYEDDCINKDITGFDVREPASNEVIFQHDGTASYEYGSYGKDYQLANTYTVPSGKNYTLKEVGIGGLNSSTTNYTISVYTNLPNRNSPVPSGATAAVSFDVTTTCRGYHTFELPSEVTLEGGTNFSIVVKFKEATTYFAVDTNDSVVSSSYGTVTFTPTTNKGDSFYKTSSGSWTDMSSSNKTARIKGIAVETGGITFTAATNATGSTSDKTVDLDKTFTVTLSTKEMKAKDIKGGITYDSSVVELVKAEGTNSAGTTAENKFYLKYDHDNDSSTAMIEKTFTGTKSTGKYEFSAVGAADCTHAAKTDFVTFTFKAKKAGDANIKLYEETSGTDEIKLSNVNPGFTVTVENALKSIAVTTAPTKTKYCAGQTFNKSGMVVKATYLDGTTKDVTSSCTYSPTSATKLTTSNTAVTISYTENGVTKTTTQAITVVNHDYVLNTSQSGTSGTGWKWTSYTKATAYVKCSLCGATANGNATITSAVTKDPTCTTTGETTYTATYTATNGQVFTTTKVNTSSPGVTSHDYIGVTPTWSWSGYTSATAKFKCNNCTHTETKTATISSKVTTEPSCTTTGVRTYTATVTFNNKQYTDSKTETIAAGHTIQTKSLVKATTSSNGNIACYYCSACKKYFSDQAGTKEITDGSWKINKIASVTLGTTSYYYDNTAKKPTVTVKDSAGKELSSSNDYSVAYEDNINAGTAKAVVTFKGNYSGTVTKNFTIVPTYNLTGNITTSCTNGLSVEIYDSENNKQTTQLSGNSSYACKYIKSGTYKIVIKGSTNYIEREYQVSVTSNVSKDISLYQLGDANCDGVLGAEDVTRIARHIAKIELEDDAYKLILFNTDRQGSEPSAADVTHLARYLANIITAL